MCRHFRFHPGGEGKWAHRVFKFYVPCFSGFIAVRGGQLNHLSVSVAALSAVLREVVVFMATIW